jgi:hypothetical protein
VNLHHRLWREEKLTPTVGSSHIKFGDQKDTEKTYTHRSKSLYDRIWSVTTLGDWSVMCGEFHEAPKSQSF